MAHRRTENCNPLAPVDGTVASASPSYWDGSGVTGRRSSYDAIREEKEKIPGVQIGSPAGVCSPLHHSCSFAML